MNQYTNSDKVDSVPFLLLTEQELLEMANVGEEHTGIPDVVIWLGPHPKKHYLRVKVSNIPNKACFDDCFTITIPGYRIIGKPAIWIKENILKDIIKWLQINIKPITRYSNNQILTADLLRGLKPLRLA